jgi:hypothetical protein
MFVSSAQGAPPPKADVSNDSITCNSVTGGSASIKPALTFAGSAQPVTIKVKGTLGGCVDNTNGAVIIDKGSFSGTLTGNSNNCTSLLGTNPATGSLSFKWTANKATPIAQTSSTQAVSTITGNLFAPAASDPAFGAAAYAEFSLGTGAVTGAFTGGDAGATSSNVTVTQQDINTFTTLCTPPAKGIKTLNFGIATITLG